MEKLKTITDEALVAVSDAIGHSISEDQAREVAGIVEQAVIKGLLEGQHRAVDACRNCHEEEQDLAHKIATEIRRKNDALIANLSSLR